MQGAENASTAAKLQDKGRGWKLLSITRGWKDGQCIMLDVKAVCTIVV